jgi:chromosome partitioning protein
LFLNGLTLLDIQGSGMSLSHVAARQEVRELLKTLNLPNVTTAI